MENTNNININIDAIQRFIDICSTEEFKTLQDMMQERKNREILRTTFSLRRGAKVTFTSSRKRTPFTYVGEITDLRQSRCTVKILSCNVAYPKYAIGSLVTVPFAMLMLVK